MLTENEIRNKIDRLCELLKEQCYEECYLDNYGNCSDNWQDIETSYINYKEELIKELCLLSK